MNICIVSYYYGDRITNVNDYFKSRNHTTTVYCSDFNHISKSYVEDEKNIEYNYVHSKSYKKNISFSRLYALNRWSKDIAKILTKNKFDLIYVIGPPNSLIYRIGKIKYSECIKICDIMDVWPESLIKSNLYKHVLCVPLFFWKSRRDDYLSKYHKVLLECFYYSKYINSNDILDKVNVLYLARKQKITNVEIVTCNDEKLNLLYLGSINNLIDIDAIKCVIKNVKFDVTVHIIGKGENTDFFIKSCENAGATVIFYGEVYDEKVKADVMSICDFGVNIYKDCAEIGLTIKSVDYLSCALPLLSNIKGDTHDIVKKYKVGINLVDDYELLSEFILKEKQTKEMRQNCVHTFEKLFSINTFNVKLDEYLMEVLK